MRMVNYQISLDPPYENRKDKRRARKRQINGEVGNIERTKDGTNRMKDMSKMPN